MLVSFAWLESEEMQRDSQLPAVYNDEALENGAREDILI